MIKFVLNARKFNTFAFFCPDSRLHLTLSSPVGFSDRVTPAILRGLKSKTIIDVDGVIDLETGLEKTEPAPVEPAEETQKASEEPEPVQEEVAAKKTRKKAAPAEEAETEK